MHLMVTAYSSKNLKSILQIYAKYATDNLFLKGNGRPTVKSLKNVEKTFFSYLLRYQTFKIHLK